jgi:hypothetical protein
LGAAQNREDVVSAMGPACRELLNDLLVSELTRYRGPDPEVRMAEFLLHGGVIGAKRRANGRLIDMIEIAKAMKGQPYGTEDEQIARVVLRKMDEQRRAVPA